MKRNYAIYLQDILDNLALAESFTAGLSYEDFRRDTKGQYTP